MFAFLVVSLLMASDVNAQSTPTGGASQSTDPQEKIVCKRFIETGSLVKGYRVCKTKRDWARAREALRATGPGSSSCVRDGEGGC
ncbi:hypothetical protein BH10PSE14_BH10PSE14_00630 [soil metagenome]